MILLRGSPEGDTKCYHEGVSYRGLLRGLLKALLRGITNALLRVLLRQSPESIMILLRGSPEGVS